MESNESFVTINDTEYVYVISDDGTPIGMVSKYKMPEGTVPLYNTDGTVINATPEPDFDNNDDPTSGCVWINDKDGNKIGAIETPSDSNETITINEESYTYNESSGEYEATENSIINQTPDDSGEVDDNIDSDVTNTEVEHTSEYSKKPEDELIENLDNIGYLFAAGKLFQHKTKEKLIDLAELRNKIKKIEKSPNQQNLDTDNINVTMRKEIKSNDGSLFDKLDKRIEEQQLTQLKKSGVGMISGASYGTASAMDISGVSGGGIIESIRNTYLKRMRENKQNDIWKEIKDKKTELPNDLKIKIELIFEEKRNRRSGSKILNGFNSLLHGATMGTEIAGIPLPLNLGTIISDTLLQTYKNIEAERNLDDNRQLTYKKNSTYKAGRRLINK